ncbi:hypothetical protein A7589_13155 [Escherichia sp. MOD1-EC6475]|nr:hypothetical protein A7589_13155 [Escherichia sp. MOD1-EC6475]
MICGFKFILRINCEAELIRDDKQKKRRRARRLGLFVYFRRKRLIRPTKARKFNTLQSSRRSDKRSASGNLAFETVCVFLAGCGIYAASCMVKLKITRQPSPRYHAAQRCG